MSMHDDRLDLYAMVIEWSDRDEAFVVTIPDLGIRTLGTTYEHAAAQGRDAIDAWIDAAEQCGDLIRRPQWRLGFAGAG